MRRQAALRARVEMAAGRADGVAGGHDAGAFDPARVDRLAQRHVEEVAPGLHEQAEVPDGREPGVERAPGVDRRPQRHLHRIGHDRIGEPGAGATEHQVHLHVHQPGQQREVGELDHLVGIRVGGPSRCPTAVMRSPSTHT